MVTTKKKTLTFQDTTVFYALCKPCQCPSPKSVLKKKGAGSPKLSLVIIIAVITHSFFCYFVIYSSDGNREREKKKKKLALACPYLLLNREIHRGQ